MTHEERINEWNRIKAGMDIEEAIEWLQEAIIAYADWAEVAERDEDTGLYPIDANCEQMSIALEKLLDLIPNREGNT